MVLVLVMVCVMIIMGMQVVMGLLVMGRMVCPLMVLVAILLVVVWPIEIRVMSVIQTKFLIINIIIQVWHQSMRLFVNIMVIMFWRVMAIPGMLIIMWIDISFHCFMIMVSPMLLMSMELWVELCVSHVFFRLTFNEMNI